MRSAIRWLFLLILLSTVGASLSVVGFVFYPNPVRFAITGSLISLASCLLIGVWRQSEWRWWRVLLGPISGAGAMFIGFSLVAWPAGWALGALGIGISSHFWVPGKSWTWTLLGTLVSTAPLLIVGDLRQNTAFLAGALLCAGPALFREAKTQPSASTNVVLPDPVPEPVKSRTVLVLRRPSGGGEQRLSNTFQSEKLSFRIDAATRDQVVIRNLGSKINHRRHDAEFIILPNSTSTVYPGDSLRVGRDFWLVVRAGSELALHAPVLLPPPTPETTGNDEYLELDEFH